MIPYLNEQCRICGHLGVDHEVRGYTSTSPKLNAICLACMALYPDIPNLDAYHKFKFGNLEYFQKLYEKKQKVK